MIIFLIFLYSFFSSETFAQSSPETNASPTLSSCVALKDEVACKALGSHGCKWSKYVQHCFNATSVKYCREIAPKFFAYGKCDPDDFCAIIYSDGLNAKCIDKQSADFVNGICTKLKTEEECDGNLLCKYSLLGENEGCFPQGGIYEDGIECYGFDKEKCFSNKKCIFFEKPNEKACKDYRNSPPMFCEHSNKKECNADEHCFWSESKNGHCIQDFECGKITDEGRCNYYHEHCKWEWNACQLVNDRFCGKPNCVA